MELSMYINAIENKLINNFDILKNHAINNMVYDLFAAYHLRNESYVLTKKAVVYAFENNEYVLLKSYDQLNKERYQEFTDNLIESAESVINPSKEHMSSIISGVIVTENIKEEDSDYINNSVKQFKYNKSFAFGFKGWVDARLILVCPGDSLISFNKKGKEVKSIYSF